MTAQLLFPSILFIMAISKGIVPIVDLLFLLD